MDQIHARHVHHILGRQGQGVRSCIGLEVDGFHAVDARQVIGRGRTDIGDLRQVQAGAAAELNGVEARATIGARKLRNIAAHAHHALQGVDVVGVEHKHIVACAAIHHIRTAATDQGVAAHARRKGFCRCRAGLQFVTGRAHEIQGGGELLTTQDDIGATGSRVPSARRADDQVGQAIPVDIARSAHSGADRVMCQCRFDDKAAHTQSHIAQVDSGEVGFTKHHIAFTGGGIESSPDQQVGKAIAIHIARAADRVAALVIGCGTVDDKAAGSQAGKFDFFSAGFAEHHIAFPCIVVGHMSTDDHIGKSVAIDIACAADRPANAIRGRLSIHGETTRTSGHCAQIDSRSASLAKHHVAGTSSRVAQIGADQQICQPIPVDITCTADSVATVFAGSPVDDKATGARSHGGQIERCGIGCAKHHKAASAVGIAGRCPDDQVGQSISIDIASAAERVAAFVPQRGTIEGKASRAQACEIDRRRVGLAVHHIAGAGIETGAAVGHGGSDDDVGQSVAIDIASRAD